MNEYIRENATSAAKMNTYKWLLDEYRANFTKKLASVDLELVISDESERFEDYNSKLFDYPYEKRRSIVSTYKMYVDDITLGTELSGYNFTMADVHYQVSQSCLEAWGYLPDSTQQDLKKKCDPGVFLQKLQFDTVTNNLVQHDD